ncbi:MAG TPA: hypothetical protein ENN13_02530 [Candidatus Altiarchaeales archaeon]|nr:hypothetical protein [Candidatus Altiarchaeales archaeon]
MTDKKLILRFGILLLLILAENTMAVGNKIAIAICNVYNAVITLAIPLATLMFIYGGARYVYSADDPGGRKAAKKICVHSLVGLIIVGVADELVFEIAGSSC